MTSFSNLKDYIGKNIMTNKGRSTRTQYVAVFACNFCILALLGVISIGLDKYAPTYPLFSNFLFLTVWYIVFSFVGISIVIANIMTTIRRLHDMNISGFWILFNIIPYLGATVIGIMCLFVPGSKESNRFGDNPRHSK
jgi:uncharacterized membrane protein YhaH (DUF805 family)